MTATRPASSNRGFAAQLAARPAAVLAFALGVQGLFLAWHRRFVQDDAFIAFHYARALAEGHGLTWFGDRVEGYTSFLWVLWMALGLRFGAEPVVWSWAGSMAAYAALLFGVWQLGLALFGAPLPALVALAIVIGNASVTAFATGGLETMLQASLLVHATVQLVALRRAVVDAAEPHVVPRITRHALVLSILCAAGLLTRLDSALFVAIFVAAALWTLRRSSPLLSNRRTITFLLLPMTLSVGIWLVWKMVYYGGLLPNTFAAKVRWDVGTLRAGLLYLWRFLDAYLLWPFLIAAAAAWALRRFPLPRGSGLVCAAIASASIAWSIYLGIVGGDFMEFRMLVPIIPFLALLIAYPAWAALPRWGALAAAGLAMLLGLASAQQSQRFDGVTPDHRLDSVPALGTFYSLYPDRDWSHLGRELQAQFGAANPCPRPACDRRHPVL
jgi:arabinofuranosyltransferase